MIPGGGNRQIKGIANPVRTQCKLCRHAILVGQPARWSTRPMGLVHDECPPW